MAGGTGSIIDMHVHTTDSPDASLKASELAARAGESGLAGIGFVAHLDFHPADFCTGAFSPGAYDRSFEEALSAGRGPVLLKGVEIGEPHLFMDRAMAALEGRSYDFVTGALHWIGDRLVLDAGGFAGTNPDDLVEEYILQSIRIAEECPIDILAHFGVWRRGLSRAGGGPGPDEALLWPDLLRRLFGVMIERGMALEVNTAGLRRPEGVTYPTRSVLGLYRECGGSMVTLGSDTHGDPHVFYGLAQGGALLAAEGFTRAFSFRDRSPVAYPVRS